MKIYKIKSNVDLTELENYGYTEDTFQDVECYQKTNSAYGVYINKVSRCIVVGHNNTSQVMTGYLDNYIDDLMRDGLVEIVEV